MQSFDHILNWRLLSGPHEFPGPAGGTCINEAAVVAAGFPYRKINRPQDCPPCFSRPLAAYLIGLNDRMPDGPRQGLMRFLLRLAGSAASLEVETERAEHIALQTVRRILPLAFHDPSFAAFRSGCRQATTVAEAEDYLAATIAPSNSAQEESLLGARGALFAVESRRLVAAASNASSAAQYADIASPLCLGEAVSVRKDPDNPYRFDITLPCPAPSPVWPEAIAIAEEAFAIGPQAPASDIALITARMEAARAAARAEKMEAT